MVRGFLFIRYSSGNTPRESGVEVPLSHWQVTEKR